MPAVSYDRIAGSFRSSLLEDDRAMRRADKIRDRLAWEPGILNGHGSKPRGMRWRIYQRLIVKHGALGDVSLSWMQGRMRMIEATLGGIGEDLNLFRKIDYP